MPGHETAFPWAARKSSVNNSRWKFITHARMTALAVREIYISLELRLSFASELENGNTPKSRHIRNWMIKSRYEEINHCTGSVPQCFCNCVLSTLVAGCGGGTLVGSLMPSDYTAPVIVGKIETDEIKESSGLSASECQDVLWTHNDAGNDAFIFGMDTRGKHLGTWKVQNAQNIDWESIAAIKDGSGKCSLLIGDIGDNDEKRAELMIYRIPEPAISPDGAASSTSNPLQTTAAEVLKFSYADGSNNAETLLIHPQTSDIYIITKKKSGPAGIHKLKPVFGNSNISKTEKVGDLSVPSNPAGMLTGGSISPDGKRVMLCDLQGGYELVLPDGANDPDAIWKQKPVVVDLGDRKQGEGVSYGRDGISLYASSEKKNAPLFQIKRKDTR